MKKYKVLMPFVLNDQGEIAKINSIIPLSEKQVSSMNLVKRGKVEIHLTKAEKKELEKQNAIESDE